MVRNGSREKMRTKYNAPIVFPKNNVDFNNVMLKIQLLVDGEVIEEKPKLVKSWTKARRQGAKMLKACEIEEAYCRIYDPDDVSDVDFITRERMITRKYVPDSAFKEEFEVKDDE